jgi:hypothetical protein
MGYNLVVAMLSKMNMFLALTSTTSVRLVANFFVVEEVETATASPTARSAVALMKQNTKKLDITLVLVMLRIMKLKMKPVMVSPLETNRGKSPAISNNKLSLLLQLGIIVPTKNHFYGLSRWSC